MFDVNMHHKRVVISHRVQASDGTVDLKTTFDLHDVPDEKILEWAASNRLKHWLDSVEINRLSSAEVKERFNDLVIECREYFRSQAPQLSAEETVFIDDLLKLMREGASMNRELQHLIRYTRQGKREGR